MTDLPEVREYEEWCAINGNAETLSYALIVPRHLADAAIVALKAECKRRERCGNCKNCYNDGWVAGNGCELDHSLSVNIADHCYWSPSKWELCDEYR